jgi:hypothetical protein
MGIFATLNRRGVRAEVGEDAPGVVEPAEGVWHGLPARFEAVGEHLAAGVDASIACEEVGRGLARDGADLGEALDGLELTYARVLGGQPDFRAVRALAVAWGEETLGYVHQISCEDPLTGLASRSHLRARLTEVYRGAEQRGESASTSHALVVVDLPLLAGGADREDPFGAALRLVRLAETVRMVFSGEESIGQVNQTRLVAIVERGDLLARRVGLLRDLVEDLGPRTGRARTWIEGLPPTHDSVGWLLDEIARG